MSKFSNKEIKALGVENAPRKTINFKPYLALTVMFAVIVGLCLLIVLQKLEITITFPPVLVAFGVAVLGLSSLYVVSKEVRQ